MRDTNSRYGNLPPRPPVLLFQIVQKFYRGAVSHYPVIELAKEQLRQAVFEWEACIETKNNDELEAEELVRKALTTLFLEFHFYVTCWLQIDLALHRLCIQPNGSVFCRLKQRFSDDIERHLAVRHCVDDTEACVIAQMEHTEGDLSQLANDSYWFDGRLFTVDTTSLHTLNELYRAIMEKRGSV
ncbi:hypothetical protein ABE137_10750 [Brevibacillus laterosporus]|uniref:Uncharacterized protein n=2 Tax=Brevibacillus TaxID=55080 RepID=A0A0F6XYT1_BRELA|nr:MULTISPECIES: hypothetical protein [Brevibacillus]AKF92566.1 hypothetical protein EX87_01875 [Brevibacillus laterosporus]MCR8986897.1 hypothetical protein [Brevibacillus laterosporus]MCZ0832633.1 hypothetical protein [Brevibacillus halotolerans]GIO01245.1 hypothetical protein J5TS2_19130 [Brevibacillus halotolerans]